MENNKIDPFDKVYELVPATDEKKTTPTSSCIMNTTSVKTMNHSNNGSDAPSTNNDELSGLKGRTSFILMFAFLQTAIGF